MGQTQTEMRTWTKLTAVVTMRSARGSDSHLLQLHQLHHHPDNLQYPCKKTPPPPRSSSPSSQTPLLTATLNAPPQAYYAGINGNVRVKCPTDLSVILTKKSKGEDSNFTDSPSQGLSNQSHPQAVFYSTLLKQLRQKAGDGAVSQQVQVG